MNVDIGSRVFHAELLSMLDLLVIYNKSIETTEP